LDESLAPADLALLRATEPFCSMDPAAFSADVPLEGILRNDCRLVRCQPGQVIVRQGDYGTSAYLVLEGHASVILGELAESELGQLDHRRVTWWQALSQLWRRPGTAEIRRNGHAATGTDRAVDSPSSDGALPLFLQDVPRVLGDVPTASVGPGEWFGELSALARTSRMATIIAADECRLVEVRWQGLRELLRRDPALRQHIDEAYREHALALHLRSTPQLAHLNDQQIAAAAEATLFESYGSFEWNQPLRSIAQRDVAERIKAEPVIAEEGHYVNGLILIRNGFARLSQRYGDGHRTIAYLGKGHEFGLRELLHNARHTPPAAYSLSLRAVGYVDTLRIPTPIVEQLILPGLPRRLWPPPLISRRRRLRNANRRLARRDDPLPAALLEFLVDRRLFNGTQAMVIDLDRCTRCDDCVRACAAAHDNNPRFVRQGPVYDRWLFAEACMHCADPVCMIGCPTGAIHRDRQTGLAVINQQTCIGCGTCANSCPYHNIRMVPIRDSQGRPRVDAANGLPILQATKCDLCLDQLGGPACQRACPHDALVRVDLTHPQPLGDWIARRHNGVGMKSERATE
jgi:Fe-S-cluster-containing dehydrogenase component/CRP-like cAMP-binding protein